MFSPMELKLQLWECLIKTKILALTNTKQMHTVPYPPNKVTTKKPHKSLPQTQPKAPPTLTV